MMYEPPEQPGTGPTREIQCFASSRPGRATAVIDNITGETRLFPHIAGSNNSEDAADTSTGGFGSSD